VKYTFGTGKIAAARLEKISDFFNPFALRLIKEFIDHSVDSALDLGCGPGFTTNMLHHALKCDKVYGLDKSDDFLSIASKRFKDCTFIKHDVTKTPFPVLSDVIYLRFLLSHLKNVAELVNRWIKELRTNGTLFIEEVEDVKTENNIFRKYLEINRGLVGSQGASLFVGSTLAKLVYDARVLCNEVITISVANWQAATWFYPNTITIWEKEKYVRNKLTATERKEISQKLLQIKESKVQTSEITWYMRRIVLKKL
jgi:trans-aconitate 2-methyltransferase